MNKIVLLGATGSVGSSVISVLRAFPDEFTLYGISGYSNLEKLATLIEEFHPAYVCTGKKETDFYKRFPETNFFYGDEGLNELVLIDADTVIVAVVGIQGVFPTITALKNGRKVISSNKESVVCAGDLLNEVEAKYHNTIVPIDSEHHAILEAIRGNKRADISKVILTASGGAMRDKEITKETTVAEVLNHPTWSMGKIITVNSATLMNKGLEIIETHHLFKLPYDKIDVRLHRQSMVHALVRFTDGSFLLTAYPTSMTYPINYALHYPNVPPKPVVDMDLEFDDTNFTFSYIDYEKFPLISLAREMGEMGGIMPASMVAINEVVVDKFLKEIVPFYKIPSLVYSLLNKIKNVKNPSIEDILIADRKARVLALDSISHINF